MRTHRAICLYILTATFWVPGCETPQKLTEDAPQPTWKTEISDLLAENVFVIKQTDRSANSRHDFSSIPTVSLQTHFYIWIFCIPEEQMIGSEELWNHLDETFLPIDDLLHLRRNGLRVGLGRRSSWPAVREILLRHKPRVWSNAVVSDGAAPLSIELGELKHSTPLFIYNSTGRLSGARYAAGLKCLRVDQLISLDEVGQLRFKMTPELYREKRTRGWQLNQEAEWSSEYEVDLFDQLAFSLTLASGQYLIIGPSHAAELPHLVGSMLTRSEENGQSCTNIYCIVPTIVRRATSAVRQAAQDDELHEQGKR